ncbi:hypothetical protein LFX25_20740 [Leptospira sp. FAT2]|uniref:hypothetical protein n=1 Tax=Leptospira sanjuanensis TaxID=2879643 RepID=UPI001EE7AF43|nr:hypothetical protein [Leptospira sanjuanensis]MCG6195674.1 hypothetical protein [Leptospira sanjuanensis]
MTDRNIEPHRITRPIQLLAAWLTGLTVVNASFLASASLIHEPNWIPAMLSIAAVVNVPVFIVSLFLLQTKFRPEMQEDEFYSKYLEKKYSSDNTVVAVDLEDQFKKLAEELASKIPSVSKNNEKEVLEILRNSEIAQLSGRFYKSRSISELFMHKDGWGEIVESWKSDPSFIADINELVQAGLVHLSGEGEYKDATLTSIGYEVATKLKAEGKLWNLRHKRRMNDKENKQ